MTPERETERRRQMQKIKLVFELPDVEDTIRGLTTRAVHPPLVEAERVLAEAERQLDDAKRRATDDTREAERVAEEAAFGRKAVGAVEVAVARKRTSLLLVPRAEQHVAQARERLAVEADRARHRVREEAARRQHPLERIVPQLVPILEQLVAMERALDQVIDRETTTLNAFGAPGGRLPSLPALVWPACLVDQVRGVGVAMELLQAAPK
jgi:hypothetical protein